MQRGSSVPSDAGSGALVASVPTESAVNTSGGKNFDGLARQEGGNGRNPDRAQRQMRERHEPTGSGEEENDGRDRTSDSSRHKLRQTPSEQTSQAAGDCCHQWIGKQIAAGWAEEKLCDSAGTCRAEDR